MRLFVELALLTARVAAQWGGSGGGSSSYGTASSPPPPPPPAISPSSVYNLRTCQNRQSESASPAEGYALQFGPQTIATTKTRFLEASNSEIAKLSGGLTMMAWVRWNDATKTRLQPPITIGNEENPDFWKPFNSLAGYLIAGRGLSVSQVFDWETDQQWHHVAVSWNNVDGEVRVWIDGSNSSDVFASALPAPHGIGKTLLGQKTFLAAGMGCKIGLQPECDTSAYFDGAIDDLAFFSGALTDAQVKERWDQPLTSRVLGGMEPNLILFYDFDSPASVNIPNLGSAGSDYDLIRGRASMGAGSTSYDSKYYDPGLQQTQTFQRPQFVPAWALPRSSSDNNSPVVTSAAAGATISIAVPGLASPESFTVPSSPWTTTYVNSASNGRSVHIVPRVKPAGIATAHLRSFSGLEDTPLVVQVGGSNELGLCMQAVIAALPSKGKLSAVATGYDSTSQLSNAIEITTAGHVLDHNQTGNYLVFEPESDDVGTPYVEFNVSFRMAEFPALISEPVVVTINVTAVNDVPKAHEFSYTISEAKRASVNGTTVVTGGYQVVQLLATDDPNEQGQPLEMFITSLPRKGKLSLQQTDDSLKEIDTAYDEESVAVGNVVSQYLNDTTVGLASFNYMLPLSPGHIYHSSDPPYTEAIQATVDTPVFISGVEIGSPQNIGGVVAVRVKNPQGIWLPLYTGAPQHDLTAGQSTQYWKWSPEVCQLNFKSNEIRVEIDTSMETGFFVGVIDYVKVIGTSEQQSAAIPFAVGANTTLIYQATSFQSGLDSFTYAASDCPGQPMRMSAPTSVELNIINSNDAPNVPPWSQDRALEVDTLTTVRGVLSGYDYDPPGSGMAFRIVEMPKTTTLTTEAGLPVVKGNAISQSDARRGGMGWWYSLSLKMYSAVCGTDEFTYSLTDDDGVTSLSKQVKINVICPRACSLSGDVEWKEGECDQTTLTRKMTASWRNFSLLPAISGNTSDDNSTECDLPRAPDLPGTVAVDCDAIDIDSSSAVGLIAAGALLSAAKAALLVYALVHRNAPIYRKAQVSFISFTILGGIMADFAPILLLGPVVTWRCHLFASWLLIATTLLYGPLVLKSYRVWRVLDNPKLKNIKEQPLKTIARLLAYILLEVIAALTMAFAAPIHAETYDFKFSEFASMQRTRCQDSAFTWVAYLLIALPILAGLYLSFKTRNAKGGHTENKPILFAFYTLAVVWVVVFAMLQVFGGTNIVFELGLVSTSIQLVSTVSVFTLMIPKMLYHRGVLVEQVMVNNTHTSTKASNNTSVFGASEMEEIAELKVELSDNRATILEQRETIAELRESILKWRRDNNDGSNEPAP